MAGQPDLHLLTEALAALARGWPLTPLAGKVPQLTAWTGQPPATEATIRAWLEQPHVTGLGLRTGTASGVFVLDRDAGKGACDAAELDLPRTPTVATPGGGEHYYFQHPSEADLADPATGEIRALGNSASRLAPGWDTRGDGGQVVYPGSLHPSGGVYRWLVSPDEAPLASLPSALLERLVDRSRSNGRAATSTPPGSAYARAALVRESARVRNMPEGQRNDALNRAAFSLGQLVAGGLLAEHDVRAQLEADAILAGLDQREIGPTIDSGLAAGMQHPRTAPERPAPRRAAAAAATATASDPERHPEVFIPGGHVLPTGELRDVSSAAFVDAVFDALPRDLLYRRGGIPGEIVDDEFKEVDRHRVRIIAERHIRFVFGKPATKADDEPAIVFRPLTGDHGELIIAGSKSDARVNELEFIATFPVMLPDWTVSPPGYSQGIYYCGPHAPEPIRDHATIRGTLEDLVADFPFTADADRENFYGLLLTPLIRVAIKGTVPMHIVHAGTDRAGKGKLANDTFGGIILGESVPTLQLGRSEEEREKRIFGMLLGGRTIHSIDNLDQTIDSAALASLLTANVFQGRELGRSHIPRLPNRMTLVGTGNNVSASSEISKRIIPIGLSPGTSPETRTDFRHPDLIGYVAEVRWRVYACLLGMIANWREAGAPRGTKPLGGFEEWARSIGGILALHGFTAWMSNAAEWRGAADEWEPQLDALIQAWADSGRHSMQAKELLALAREEGLFERYTDLPDTKAAASFGAKVLARLPERPTKLGRVRKTLPKGKATYHLEALGPDTPSGAATATAGS